MKSPYMPASIDADAKPACDGHYRVFWELIDREAGAEWRAARREAREFCHGIPGEQPPCPLLYQCIPDNIAAGGYDAHWASAIGLPKAKDAAA